MMSAEAILSSTLALAALLLSASAPTFGSNLIDFYQYQSLEDFAAICAEKNLTCPQCVSLAQENPNFCITCAISQKKALPPIPKECSPETKITISRPIFASGQLQYLTLSKFEKNQPE
ncbi:hypothetical protein COU37_05925 [Candidatus Micrarchaeota archaeon CG10_big_fil_rev_8_21_14_0_10_45_29]|nr:MAG: hypothetical protein COU37_05925 [Candidatus Micrarchaeota archaeon CG10_big_fil_rev_8_21_14_0_10_45_29]